MTPVDTVPVYVTGEPTPDDLRIRAGKIGTLWVLSAVAGSLLGWLMAPLLYIR